MGKFDGITVGGDSVESFLTDEHTKDVLDAKETKLYPKKKGRVKYMDKKEPHGKAISLREKVVGAFMAGRNLTGKDVVKDFNVPHLTTANQVLRSIYLSEFGELYITRITQRIKGKNHFVYGIPEYIEGVKWTDIKITLKTAMKLAKAKPIKVADHTADATPATPVIKGLGQTTPQEEIQKHVIVNVTVRLKLEVV